MVERDLFRKWLNQNADKLLQNYPTLKKHEIYIATMTYSCSNIHINVWHSKEDEIKIEVKVGVIGIAGLGPSGRWMRGKDRRLPGNVAIKLVGNLITTLERAGKTD